MRGLEGMPLRFTASMAIIAVIVSVGFYELTVFLDFQNQKNVKEDIINARQAFRTLRQMGDEGSFTSLQLHVPSGYRVTINNETDVLVSTLPTGENFTVNTTVNMLQMTFPGCLGNPLTNCTLGAGDYEIRLIYSEPGQEKNYTIYFK